VLALLLAVACVSTGPTQAGQEVELVPGREFDLAAGRTARIAGAPATVRFDQVTEDSRCPVDVTCVWEGDAIVRLQVERPDADRVTVDLHTNAAFAREAATDGYLVRLIRLAPLPREGQTTPPERYVATLVVSTR
jgi:hypothetical protein